MNFRPNSNELSWEGAGNILIRKLVCERMDFLDTALELPKNEADKKESKTIGSELKHIGKKLKSIDLELKQFG